MRRHILSKSRRTHADANLGKSVQTAAMRQMLRLHWSWILLCLTLPAIMGQDSFSKYSIDWTTVPTTTGSSSRSVSGTCVCKASVGSCTPNCCCDPECPAALVQQYKGEGSCLPEGPSPDQLQYCAASEPISKVSSCAAKAILVARIHLHSKMTVDALHGTRLPVLCQAGCTLQVLPGICMSVYRTKKLACSYSLHSSRWPTSWHMSLPAQVNLPSGDYYRVDQVAPDDTFLGQLLCIQSDANPNLGNLYSGKHFLRQAVFTHAGSTWACTSAASIVVSFIWGRP